MNFADVIMIVVVTSLLMVGLLWPWFEDYKDLHDLE